MKSQNTFWQKGKLRLALSLMKDFYEYLNKDAPLKSKLFRAN